jgi:hypothetical protein
MAKSGGPSYDGLLAHHHNRLRRFAWSFIFLAFLAVGIRVVTLL